MSEELKNQRDSYVSQLNSTEQKLQSLDQDKARLLAQREQLKGAIFALDTLASAVNNEAQPETEEAADTSESSDGSKTETA